MLCENLLQQDRENGDENNLLFDIVAGTSIGAMNGAILVSQFLKTRNWERAAEKLEKFWTEQLSLNSLDASDLNKQWHEQWMKRNPTAASEEVARRYYSVKKLLSNQVRNNMYYLSKVIDDTKFFDNSSNRWYLHSSKPLQESIEKYAKFPIATAFVRDVDLMSIQEPRLLVFSVDVAEGITVTFDSYPKKDGSRRSNYGKGNKKVIHYNDGISIHQIMASGTLPEFYDYAPVPVDSNVVQKNQDENCRTDISDKNIMQYFWDGGLLSNTPLRELLQAHQEYWEKVENADKIPDLDVYIINVHPSRMDINPIPNDHDGIMDRKNDIIFGDRTSHQDEEASHLITDYSNFVIQLKDLADKAIHKIDDKETKDRLNEKLQEILVTKTYRNERKDESRTYNDLMKNNFK
ncbi:MAG: patatin-like phospholipase family protein, partial [Candidatus Nitrosocosmicus sp.]|nr:patatin-like phospholipase family protein [Candidatus Nitrosocosmicus sp.]